MSGIANFSDDQWINWFAKGKTDFTGNSLEVVHGTSSQLTLGIASEVFLGTQTTFTAGMKIEATVGGEFTVMEAASIGSKNREEEYYMSSYAAAVGASENQARNMNRLRIGIFALLAIQTLAMTTASGAAMVLKLEHPNEEKDLGLPELGITLAALNHISSILAVLVTLLATFRKKWFGIAQPADPSAVLTLDRVGGVFLGARLNDSSGGVTIGDSGLQLSAAEPDLGYTKAPGSPSIIGFTSNAEDHGGSRVEVRKDGETKIYGSQLIARLRTANGPSATTFKAQQHHLLVTGANSYTNAGPALELDEDTAIMRHSWNNYLMATDEAVTANAGGQGGSILELKSNQSSLSTQGTTIRITPGKIEAGRLTIDQQGMKFGNDLTVLTGPNPPVMVNNVEINALQVAAQQAEQQAEINEQQQNAEANANQVAVQAQIGAQNVVNEG